MENLFSFLLLICCCYASSKKLTEREIRNNFNDVQTGMGVLLRELLVVMDENERLSNDLNKTSFEFKKLKHHNKNIANSIRSVKRMLKSSKIKILKVQEKLFTNLTKEQKKMKQELSKFVTNKYAFLAWMVYKLESQNKEQEKMITDLRFESTKQKIKTIQLEEELKIMQKKLDGCEKSIKKNEEIMMEKTRAINELQNSVASILRSLGTKQVVNADKASLHTSKDSTKFTTQHKKIVNTTFTITDIPNGKTLIDDQKPTVKPTQQRNNKRNETTEKPTRPINTTDIRSYLFTTSYKRNMTSVNTDEFDKAISKYTSHVPKHSETSTKPDEKLPQPTELDTSYLKVDKTVVSSNKPKKLKKINADSNVNNPSESVDSSRNNIIIKKRLIKDNVIVKQGSPLLSKKTLIRRSVNRT